MVNDFIMLFCIVLIVGVFIAFIIIDITTYREIKEAERFLKQQETLLEDLTKPTITYGDGIVFTLKPEWVKVTEEEIKQND